MHDCWNGTWYFNVVEALRAADTHGEPGWALVTSRDVVNGIVALAKLLADALDVSPPEVGTYVPPEKPYKNEPLVRALLAAARGVGQDAAAAKAHDFPTKRGWLLRPLEAPNGFAQRAAAYLLERLAYAVAR